MYIDFKLLKERLDVQSVIKYFSISNLRQSSDALVGPCPIHKGDNNKAFRFDIRKKIYHCFTHCGGGNILDFIGKMKNSDIYHSALIGNEILGINNIISSDLGFRLQLKSEHIYLTTRDLTIETAKYFGIGYCDRGYLKNKIAIPIYSENNELAGYAGRAIDNSIPKYLFPKGFKKSQYVYNYNKVKEGNKNNEPVFITEGFFDVYRLHQAGYFGVALMGVEMSVEQLNLLKNLKSFYILMLDGDEAGRQATDRLKKELNFAGLAFRVIYLDNKSQPDNLSREEIMSIINNS